MTKGTNGHKPPRPRTRPYRCPNCGRLLFEAWLAPGSWVEIRCTRTRCAKRYRIEHGNDGLFLAEIEETIEVSLTNL